MKRRFFVPIIFFVIFLIGVYLLWPKYREFQDLKRVISEKETILKQKQEDLLRFQEISAQLENYRENLEKIDTALPKEISLADLLNFFQSKASASGLIVKTISQSQASAPAPAKPAGPSQETKQEEKTLKRIQENYFSLSLLGSLSSLEEFLHLLEKSARMVEVETISVTESGEGVLEFNLLVKVYSRK